MLLRLFAASFLALGPLFGAEESPSHLIAKLASAEEWDRPAVVEALIRGGSPAAVAIQTALEKALEPRVFAHLVHALSRLNVQVSSGTLQRLRERALSKDIASEFIVLEAIQRLLPGYEDRKSVFAGTTLESKTKCRSGKHQFEALLTHPNSPEDDRQDTFVWLNAKSMRPVVFSSSPSDLRFSWLNPEKVNSVCDKTLAFRVRENLVAVLLRQNDPPGADTTAVVYVDPTNGEPLGNRLWLGKSNPPRIEAEGGDLLLQINAGPTDSAEFESDRKNRIEGAFPSRVGDEMMPIWARVSWNQRKVEYRQDNELTWKRSPIRRFFADRSAFEKAFGWDEGKKHYGEALFRLAEFPNSRKRCLVPGRAIPQKGWVCR